jgi:hypothetical protein
MVPQQRHAAELLSIYDHNAYHHNHQDIHQIAAHFTQAQYHPNIHHQTVHKVPSIRARSLESLALINSCFHVAEQLKHISHHQSVLPNGVGDAHLHLNFLFAKLTIFAACISSS